MLDNYRQNESGIYVQGLEHQLKERIAELELAQEDQGWLALGNAGTSFEFSRPFVTTITRLARLMYLKNPLVNRGVNVRAAYVYGRGVNIQAKDETINDVIQAFLDDDHNQTELTAHAARVAKERELQTDGNIFFVLVPHRLTGHIRIYTIDVDEVTNIITNPANRKASWYYKREWIEVETNFDTGDTKEVRKAAYYRDWRNKPDIERKRIGAIDVVEEQFVYHVKTGGFSNWKFGISEFYSAIDWAKAYKSFLENWSTIVAAYARFAFKVTTTGGKAGVAAAKTKLATTVSTTTGEHNPAPSTGANVVMQQGNDIEPIRTQGAQTSAEDGRRLLLMVAATFGLPETFFGDVSVGTLATATSLDRPTELMLTDRQTLWADIYQDILDFVLFKAVTAISGPLRTLGDVITNEYGEEDIVFNESINDRVVVTFPPIVQHSLQEQMTAITQGAAYIPDVRELTRMVLSALGENDVDEMIAQLYPDGAPVSAPAVDPNINAVDTLGQAAQDMRAAIEALREALGLSYERAEPLELSLPTFLRD
jgi:hypothetical protein